MKSLLLTAIAAIVMAGTPAAGQAPAPVGLILHATPSDLPHIQFQDGEGRTRSLADFRGKIVLLNIWATWCGPCRKEMPTLDRLQAELGGPDFEVVALSIDRGGPEVVRKFFDEIAVKNLALYIDSSAKAGTALRAFGLPVTLLLDREGRELGRLVGPAEWDTPEMVEFFKGVIAQKTGRLAPSRHESAGSLASAAWSSPLDKIQDHSPHRRSATNDQA